MADRQLVLAFFPDEPAADNAAAALKDSGTAHGDAIGILALDSHGKLKQDKVGARSTGKGAAIGGVLFLLGPALLGVGVIGGAAAGALHHKNLGLSDADKAAARLYQPRERSLRGVSGPADAVPSPEPRFIPFGRCGRLGCRRTVARSSPSRLADEPAANPRRIPSPG